MANPFTTPITPAACDAQGRLWLQRRNPHNPEAVSWELTHHRWAAPEFGVVAWAPCYARSA